MRPLDVPMDMSLGCDLGSTYDHVVGLRMTADFYPFDMKFLGHVATRREQRPGRYTLPLPIVPHGPCRPIARPPRPISEPRPATAAFS